MPRLVALALPGGPRYVDALRRVWDAGDAIAPLDLRLPRAEQARVLAALAPAAVIEGDGEPRSLPDGAPVEPGDAAVVATSGTTGLPKGVIHTHRSIEASALATSAALGVDPATDRWLACLPLAHIGGLAVVMRSLVSGTPVEVHDGFDADAVLDAAGRGATLVSLVTRALNQIPADAFRAVLIGGAAPPPDRPSNVIATYGMTETGSGVVYERRALDGVEIDIDDGGEIRLRGPMLFRAYRHDPDPFAPGGWFPTGDLGRWGEDGRLVVDGRRGDVIVTGGEKVWPTRIEALLGDLADVAEIALVGRPDPDWGHRVVAVVVPTDPEQPPTLDDLRAITRQEFPAWCAPRQLELRSALPRTSLGKIRRDLLTRPDPT
ncbi:MAG: class I adenylate-forming enzyme family protein [Acidimicrobiales bacterium]